MGYNEMKKNTTKNIQKGQMSPENKARQKAAIIAYYVKKREEDKKRK